MQSHFGRAQTGPNDGQKLRRDPARLSPGCGLACEQSALLDPVQRQIKCCQTRRAELDGLPAPQDRLDQIRAQKGEANQASDVAPGNAVTLSQVLQRSDSMFAVPRPGHVSEPLRKSDHLRELLLSILH